MTKLRAPIAWTLDAHLQHERLGSFFKWGLLKAIIRRSFLEETKICYRPEFRMGEDSLLYMELLAHGAHAFIVPEPMYIYSTSQGELSGKASGSSTSNYRLEDHMKTYEYFRNNYSSVLTPKTLALLDKCEQMAVASDQAITFKQGIKARHFLASIKRATIHPLLVLFLWYSLLKFLRFRLRFKLICLIKHKRNN